MGRTKPEFAAGRAMAVAVMIGALGLVSSNVIETASATFPGANGRLVFAASCGIGQLNDRPSDCASNGVRKFRAINPKTGKRLPFDAGFPRRCDDEAPRFSPDGLRLAFNRFHPGEGRVRAFVSDAAGGGATQVRRFGATPSWSPNGNALAIGGEGGIRIFRPNGTFVRRVTTARAYNLDWSSNGQIVFTGGSTNSLYTVSGKGGPIRRLTRCDCIQQPSWSPDGLHLTYYRFYRGTGRPDVFVMDADGSNRRRIARWANSPVWSPDGRKIAFVRPDRAGRGALVVIARPDGSNARVKYKIRREVLPSIGQLAWQPRHR